MSFAEFLGYYQGIILKELLRHLEIIAISIPISIIVSIPLGFYISPRPKLAKFVIYIASILMTIPSLALFGIMVILLAPFKLGLGIVPAIIAIALYSILPITRNTYIALNQVSQRMIEAAKGMGMTNKQILWKIKIPLSIPIIMAGIRNAIVLGVSVATFASLVAAGGLGYFIFAGIGRSNLRMVLVGAVLVSILGISVNYFLLMVEDWITPKGLKVER
ncbi:ABC transporter permease [bacterium]|nr:ABC transporter permease [bacterium]MBU2439542.1 ABC transporter permease [bacterium]MBU4561882.1 ABC transporter permease [bacterium]